MRFLSDVVLFYTPEILSFEIKTMKKSRESVRFTARKSVFNVQYDLFKVFVLIPISALP